MQRFVYDHKLVFALWSGEMNNRATQASIARPETTMKSVAAVWDLAIINIEYYRTGAGWSFHKLPITRVPKLYTSILSNSSSQTLFCILRYTLILLCNVWQATSTSWKTLQR